MYMAQAEIISDVIEEHFDEAAFLYQSRLQALASHRIGLSAFRRIEQRLLAHLDGLLVGGEMAWRLVEPNLQGPTRAAVAIAAYVACGLGEDPYIEQLYAVLRDAPSPIFCGVRDALRHTSSHDAVDSLSRWLSLPGSTIGDMAEHLERTGLLAIADDGRLFPARDIASITVRQIIQSVRSRSSGHHPHPRAGMPGVQRVQEKLEAAWRDACGEETLAELIEDRPPR